MSKGAKIVTVIAIVLVLFVMMIRFSPTYRARWNNWWAKVQKADDATNYETVKKVEDTCRSMIASYNADKLTWEQYRESDNEEKQSWAEQAKMRANKTAVSYNEYILKNNYVWSGNIPSDIREELEVIP